MGIFSGNDQNDTETRITELNSHDDDEFSKNFQEAQDSFNKLVSSTSSIAKALGDEVSKNSFDLFNKFTPSVLNPSSWFNTEFDEPFFRDGSSIDEVFDRAIEKHGHFFGPFGGEKPWNHFRNNLWAYPVPSVRKYDACMAKEGLSVWDKDGVWRCLFPKAGLPLRDDERNNNTVTKEDYLDNINDARSNFFENFNDLLGWKSQMRRLAREERQKRFEERKKRYEDLPPSETNFDLTNTTEITKNSSNINGADNEKKIIGTSKSISTRTVEDGVEKYSKITKWYDDGTSQVEETKRLLPKDGSEPKIESSIRSLGSNESEKSGWFWDN